MDQRTLAPRTLETLTAYEAKLMATQTANLLRYWPLSDAAGTVVTELVAGNSGEHYHGVTLGQTGIGDGSTCPLFDGINDYVDVLSDGLAAGYSHDEGTMFAWIQLEDAEWVDATRRAVMIIKRAAAFENYVDRTAVNNQLATIHYTASPSTTKGVWSTAQGGVNDFFTVAHTWSVSGNIVEAFFNGVTAGHNHDLASASGAVTLASVGDYTGTDRWWKGKIAHVAIWTKALTAAELVTLSSAT